MKQAAKILVGSVTLYFVMAACAAEERAQQARGGSSGSGQNTSSGAAGDDDDDDQSSSGTANTSSGGSVSPVPDALAEDGSRLKARFLQGADGSKLYTGAFRDTDRGDEPCAFQTAADGKYRCLPTAEYASPSVFLDPECTTVIYRRGKNPTCPQPAPKYLSMSPTSQVCGAGFVIHLAGEAIAPATVYVGGPGACSPTAGQAESYEIYRVGAEVPAEVFAEATLQ